MKCSEPNCKKEAVCAVNSACDIPLCGGHKEAYLKEGSWSENEFTALESPTVEQTVYIIFDNDNPLTARLKEEDALTEATRLTEEAQKNQGEYADYHYYHIHSVELK